MNSDLMLLRPELNRSPGLNLHVSFLVVSASSGRFIIVQNTRQTFFVLVKFIYN